MLEVLGVSSSFLTYHLENLGELVGKMDGGKYKLSSFGEAAITTMTKVEDIPTTVLQQSPETKPKKVVGRSVAIALGIICIVLVACLAGTITVLNTSNQGNTNLQSQVDGLTSTINLTKSEIFYNNVSLTGHGGYEDQSGNEHYPFQVNVRYSGYLGVQVQPFDPHFKVDVSWDYQATYETFPHPYFDYFRETKYIGPNDPFFTNVTTTYYPVVASGTKVLIQQQC